MNTKNTYSVIRNISLFHIDLNLETDSILLHQETEAKVVEHNSYLEEAQKRKNNSFLQRKVFLLLLSTITAGNISSIFT